MQTSAIAPVTNSPVCTADKPYWSAVNQGATQKISCLRTVLDDIHKPLWLVGNGDELLLAQGGQILFSDVGSDTLPLKAMVPALHLSDFGDVSFSSDHNIDYPYMAGAMANGIASVALVEALAKKRLLGSFGAAGLDIDTIDKALQQLKVSLEDKTFAVNLIYTPAEVGHEDRVVDLLLKHKLSLAECSAYLNITLPAVRFRVHGIHEKDGEIIVPNRIIAKASRIELARHWFSPPPEKLLQQLLASGEITDVQAQLARQIPMAQDLTVEADSGGHTDNRPAIAMLPTMLSLRDQLQSEYNYSMSLRVGLGGGIATPVAVAAAFAMGAAYIVTGTINQACQESGSSELVREMLASAEQADVAMAPAVDMFEMGVKLQVLKRGTLFAMRANKLYELYKAYDSLEQIPAQQKQQIEKMIFRQSIAQVWQATQNYFTQHDPTQIQRAEQDPKHKMALVFRWYLGLSSRWANAGDTDRQADFQVWMGPAMGAFNQWTQNSFLAEVTQRTVTTVAMNLLYGGAVQMRINSLQQQGISLLPEQTSINPLTLAEIEQKLAI